MTDPVFFPPSRSFTAEEIASLTGALLDPKSDAHSVITGVAPLSEGGEGKIVFAKGASEKALVSVLSATAILCPPALVALVPPGIAILTSRNPQADFTTLVRLLFPTALRPGAITDETGVSRMAVVSKSAEIEPDVIIEAGAVVAAGAAIGSSTVIGPGAVIGRDVQIGRECYVGPGASILAALIGNKVVVHAGVRIGQDGFGYLPSERGLEKSPQIGRVVIQDDVEIGANTTIDRGAVGDTIIGEATKIDNLVQIAHNVRIGRHCAIAAQCGISGSVNVGDGVLIGGQVGVADHIDIGSGARLAAGAGVNRDIPPDEVWIGRPAKPRKQFVREQVVLEKTANAPRSKGRSSG